MAMSMLWFGQKGSRQTKIATIQAVKLEKIFAKPFVKVTSQLSLLSEMQQL